MSDYTEHYNDSNYVDNNYSRYHLVNVAFELIKFVKMKDEKNRSTSELVYIVSNALMEGKIFPEDVEKIKNGEKSLEDFNII